MGKMTYNKAVSNWYGKVDLDSTITNFISIHIPRTGGSTFRYILYQMYGLINVLHDETGKIHIPKLVTKGMPRNHNRFKIIHGHFGYHKYVHWGAPVIVWVRDPADLVVSMYHAIKRKRLMGKITKVQRRIAEEKIDVLEFAKDKSVRNTMYKFIGNTPLEKFAFIGITNDYERSLDRFQEWTGILVPSNYDRRNGLAYDHTKITDGLKEEIRNIHRKDTKIYNEACLLVQQ